MRTQDEMWGSGWEKQRTRAVASLEMRRRVVANFERSHSQGNSAPIYIRVAPGPLGSNGHWVRTRLAIPFSTTTTGRYSMRFAPLAMGCNPASI